MQFRVLGPLELSDDGRTVPVQGTKQRAMLGFLLFNANRVVSTSALMEALWPVDEPPNSARKIMHNAIWGLRGTLNPREEMAGRASLITRPPGYTLQLDPESVDLYRFHRLSEEGRAQLAGGSTDGAAATLRQALALWRGDALADLVEAGFDWPELTGVENARIDALEDYFEAELALGRHHAVLREIEAAVEAGTLRERLCGQLMLALYRCGRHTDALGSYNRLRERLVEELGLEPGHRLQSLQQAILRHDDDTLLVTEAERPPAGNARPGAAESARPRTVITSARPELLRRAAPPEPPAAEGAVVGAWPAAPGPVRPDAREYSVVMVQTAVDDRGAAPDDPHVESSLASVADSLRDTVEYLGGVVAAPAGPALLAVFTGDRAPERAVSAALAMLTCLPCTTRFTKRQPVSVRATVATGEAQLYRLVENTDAPAMVVGPAVDTCRTLLARTSAGTVRADGTTRARAHTTISYSGSGGTATGWRVRSAHWRSLAHPSIPIIDRDPELDVLGSLLARSRHRSVPQLVTLLGGVGSGKTRLVLEFEGRAMARWDDTRFLMSGPECVDRPLGLLRDFLLALCDAPCATETATVAGLVRQRVYASIADPNEAAEVDAGVTELITTGGHGPAPHRVEPLTEAGIRLLRAVALAQPLVLFVDDGHELDDASLDFLEQLVDSPQLPSLMVLLAARPQLLDRRPSWGSGQVQGTTLSLSPLSDATVDRLSDILLAKMRQGVVTFPTTRIGEGFGEQMVPSGRRKVLRTLMRMDASMPPQRNLGGVGVGRRVPQPLP
ncbi:BTAD domain-containing putative transcriptional regulator [Streptomyces sp. NPDC059896]|uniref:BTAD domain-containing putative transcriptional regulator n=1 Tax=Streptomyces sp. NPDC059896 TaxID=3346993 RepID=UPI00365263F6